MTKFKHSNPMRQIVYEYNLIPIVLFILFITPTVVVNSLQLVGYIEEDEGLYHAYADGTKKLIKKAEKPLSVPVGTRVRLP